MQKGKYIFIGLFLITLCSCHFYTEISYRIDKNEKYIREDGYIVSCEKDKADFGDALIIGTYTPESWGEGFYYGYLEGKKSDKKIKITTVKLKLLETNDTLSLKEIHKE